MRAARLVIAGCLALGPAFAGTPALAGPTALTGSAVPAAPRACQPQRSPYTKLTTTPWPQTRFDFDQLWKLTKGKGVTVAVVDTGVDAGHPQLAGRVRSIDVTKTGPSDCLGHGTEVAGIIGAQDQRDRNRPFAGIAPDAKILSVKYTNEEHSSGADPNLAKAIKAAAGAKGVKVINVSSTAPDTPDLREAVKYAQSRDILVVAAAGNVTDQQRGKEVPAYPAGYDGVIGVAAVDQNGQISDFSNERTQIAVAAPGKAIPTTYPGGAYNPAADGTSFAAPFVAGLAALVRSYRPNLTYQQVANRIEATAEGTSGAGSGRGMVNPFEAIQAEIPDNAPVPAPPKIAVRPVRIDPPPPVDTRTRGIAVGVTLGAIGVAALVAVVGAVIPMGRRRGWKPGRVELPRD
ncbi:MAG TPA: S8 family serine peptidase [Streptosporangiaceae bacterium]|jgi:type VII secretion-associated serine protease mycosin